MCTVWMSPWLTYFLGFVLATAYLNSISDTYSFSHNKIIIKISTVIPNGNFMLSPRNTHENTFLGCQFQGIRQNQNECFFKAKKNVSVNCKSTSPILEKKPYLLFDQKGLKKGLYLPSIHKEAYNLMIDCSNWNE